MPLPDADDGEVARGAGDVPGAAAADDEIGGDEAGVGGEDRGSADLDDGAVDGGGGLVEGDAVGDGHGVVGGGVGLDDEVTKGCAVAGEVEGAGGIGLSCGSSGVGDVGRVVAEGNFAQGEGAAGDDVDVVGAAVEDEAVIGAHGSAGGELDDLCGGGVVVDVAAEDEAVAAEGEARPAVGAKVRLPKVGPPVFPVVKGKSLVVVRLVEPSKMSASPERGAVPPQLPASDQLPLAPAPFQVSLAAQAWTRQGWRRRRRDGEHQDAGFSGGGKAVLLIRDTNLALRRCSFLILLKCYVASRSGQENQNNGGAFRGQRDLMQGKLGSMPEGVRSRVCKSLKETPELLQARMAYYARQGLLRCGKCNVPRKWRVSKSFVKGVGRWRRWEGNGGRFCASGG